MITGVVLAASELGWEVLGIRDGFEGLLFPDRYPNGGVMTLTPAIVENLTGATGCILGTAAHSDPFHVRTINAENIVEEIDRSDELLGMIQKEKIDAVISVVGARALSILWKLSRKGLTTVCVPKSVENDVAAGTLRNLFDRRGFKWRRSAPNSRPISRSNPLSLGNVREREEICDEEDDRSWIRSGGIRSSASNRVRHARSSRCPRELFASLHGSCRVQACPSNGFVEKALYARRAARRTARRTSRRHGY